MPSQFIKCALGAGLIFGVSTLLNACAAPQGGAPPAANPTADSKPVGDASNPNKFNVSIHTNFDVLYIDDLELEFNQRRGIREMLGFDETNFKTLTSVPWSELDRVDFEGQVDSSIWEQIFAGREDQGIRQEQVFKVKLQYRNGSNRYFYAIISKFRGYQDGVKWEMNMTGNSSVDYILFNPGASN